MNEQPAAMRIADITDEAEEIKTFRFAHRIDAKAGQFILLWIPSLDMKPFGISRLSKNWFDITVSKVGRFTEELFKKKVGDRVGIQGPYGKGFSTTAKKAVLIGGGYGAGPLAFLADTLALEGADVTFILGAKTKDQLLYKNRFEHLITTTDDGSSGKKGLATDALKEILETKEIDRVYTCGPEIMMKGVIKLTDEFNIPCEASLERYMKCGFGVCGQCCVDGCGSRVCMEGPVFDKETIKKDIQEFQKHKRDATGKKVML